MATHRVIAIANGVVYIINEMILEKYLVSFSCVKIKVELNLFKSYLESTDYKLIIFIRIFYFDLSIILIWSNTYERTSEK